MDQALFRAGTTAVDGISGHYGDLDGRIVLILVVYSKIAIGQIINY